MQISLIDLAILVPYLTGIMLFGARFRRGQNSLRGRFLGGRSAPWWALACSVVATETSTFTIIGTPAIAFGGNLGSTARAGLSDRASNSLSGPNPALLSRRILHGLPASGEAIRCANEAGGRGVARTVSQRIGGNIFPSGTKFPAGGQRDPTIGGGWKVAGVRFHPEPDANLYLLVRDSGWCISDHDEPRDGQTMVHRLLAARNEQDSKTALLASGVIVFVPFSMFLVIGVMLFVYTQHSAFPVPGGRCGSNTY
jgi:hypothetical protein